MGTEKCERQQEGTRRRITLKRGERIVLIDVDSENRQYIEVDRERKSAHN